MRAKLIKVDNTRYYNLENEKGILIGTTFEFKNDVGENLYSLSLKNCQAVELGVDLDTLVLSFYPKTEWDVEIIMGDPIGIGDKYTPDTKPMLNENGCLILKRIKE